MNSEKNSMQSNNTNSNNWIFYTLLTVLFWGIWGAFTEIPAKRGFPGTLIFLVWSITMIIPAVFVLKKVNWKIESNKKQIFYGLMIGFLGAGGQLLLFTGAIKHGPAYLIFPIISLSPVVTIVLSFFFLKEKATKKAWIGIALALLAIPLLSYQDAKSGIENYNWLIYALLVFLAWGLQAVFMKKANDFMSAESIFFYMALTGLIIAPFALLMTDFSQKINYGWDGPYLSFVIQLLNSVGALAIVYAFRYGKAIVVSPLTNAVAPVITVILSLIIYAVIPHPLVITGMIIAVLSTFILANE